MRIMKKAFLIILSLALTVSMIPTTFAAEQKETDNINTFLSDKFVKPDKTYVEGEAIVLLNEKTASISKKSLQISDIPDIKITETIEFENTASISASSVQSSTGMTILNVESDKYSTSELIAVLKEIPDVKYAEPNFICKTSALTNDTYSKYQWNLKNEGQNAGTDGVDINVDAVWQNGKSGTDKVIAVIDTGIDYTHEDLKERMWINTNLRTLPGKYGYDFANGDDNPLDDNGHGSHCAGIIAAQADNGKGISGINKKAKLMALKLLDNYGEGYILDAIKCYNYIYKAQSMGVDIVSINNSWGGYGVSEILTEIVNKVGAKGAVTVFAAGNDSEDLDDYEDIPCNTENPYVITVAAVNEKGELANFSNYGVNSVDIAAPGTNILSSVCTPTFNPSIYDDKNEMTDYFTDFSSVQTFPAEGGNYYKHVEEDGVLITENIDSAEYFGTKSSEEKSLKWEISDAEADSIYNLYLPYDGKTSNTTIYNSLMCKIASVPSSDEYDDMSVLCLSDIKLTASGEIPETFSPYYDYLDYTVTRIGDNDWTHLTGTLRQTTGKRAIVISLVTSTPGDYTVYLDDIGVSKAGLASENYGKYDFYSGTSMAAPVVTGAVALIKEANPNYSAERLASAVSKMARPVAELKDKISSGGILDLSNYNIENPAVKSVSVDSNGNISLTGFAFGAVKGTVKANNQIISEANITWSDKLIKFNKKDLINKQVTFEVTNAVGTARISAYMVMGKTAFRQESFGKFSPQLLTTDGKNLYGISTKGALFVQEDGEWEELSSPVLSRLFPKIPEANSTSNSYGVDFSFQSTPVYLNGSFYFIGILKTGYSEEYCLGAYNLNKDSWSLVSGYPNDDEYTNLINSTLTMYNGKLYLLGGIDIAKHELSSSVRIFDLTKKTWSKGVNMPEGRFNVKAQQIDNQLVIALGGNKEGTSPKTLVFNGSSWKEGKAIPNPLNALEFKLSAEEGNYKIFKYYNAAMGIISGGIVFSGLPCQDIGDTIYYNISSNTYTTSTYQLSRKIDLTNNYDGVSVGNKFYVCKIETSDYEDEDDEDEDDEDDDDDYYYGSYGVGAVLYSMSVKSGLLKISQTVLGGKISGAGYHLPGQTVNLKVVPNKGYYFAGDFKVGSQVIKGSSCNILVNKNINVSAKFKKYKTKVSLSLKKATLKVGKKLTLKSKVTKYLGKKGVTWKSSNRKYATVTKSGKVKTLKAGIGKTVTITATAKDGSGAKAKCKIAIYSKKIKFLKLSLKSTSLKKGKQAQIKVKYSPSSGVIKTLKWSSSNEKYATVSKNGKVTAKSAGVGKKVVITAKTTDGSNKKAKITIKIK